MKTDLANTLMKRFYTAVGYRTTDDNIVSLVALNSLIQSLDIVFLLHNMSD